MQAGIILIFICFQLMFVVNRAELPESQTTIDAKALKEALTDTDVADETRIIEILAWRTTKERLKIVNEYSRLFKKHINSDINLKLKDDFKDLVLALVKPLSEFYAKDLYTAMEGVGTDEEALINIICTLTPKEIKEISNTFTTTYQDSLQGFIRDDTSGPFRDLLLCLSQSERDDSTVVDKAQAVAVAQRLYQDGGRRFPIDDSAVIEIVCRNNYNQLQQIFEEYKTIARHDIEEDMMKEFANQFQAALIAVVKVAKGKTAEYFARRLDDKLILPIGKKRRLIRIIVGRKEIDLPEIRSNYRTIFGIPLVDVVKGDTSGSFKTCLLELLSDSQK